MKPINFMDVRVMCRSGAIGIDLNSHIFNHPYYSHIPIAELDNKLKELAFNNSFHKLSDRSFNPEFVKELQSQSAIQVCAVFYPTADFVSTRGLKGFRLMWHKFLNYLHHRDKMIIRPGKILVVPLSIQINEGIEVPRLDLLLPPELVKQGLSVLKVTPGSKTNNSETTVTLINGSRTSAVLDDLCKLGELRLMN